MKRTLALLLALTLMMSVLVIPASAVSVLACPTCDKICVATFLEETSGTKSVSSCNNVSYRHDHYVYYDVYRIECYKHGVFNIKVETSQMCP